MCELQPNYQGIRARFHHPDGSTDVITIISGSHCPDYAGDNRYRLVDWLTATRRRCIAGNDLVNNVSRLTRDQSQIEREFTETTTTSNIP